LFLYYPSSDDGWGLTVILRRHRTQGGLEQVAVSIGIDAASLFGCEERRLEFGRFLLSSALLHVGLAWVLLTVPFHRTQPAEKPLQVKLVDEQAPKPSRAASRPVRRNAPAPVAVRSSSQAPDPDSVIPRELHAPSLGRVVATAPRITEAVGSVGADGAPRPASRLSAEELVRDLGVAEVAERSPGRIAGSDGPRAIGGARLGAGVTIVPSAHLSSGPASIGAIGSGDGGGGLSGGARARRLDDGLAAILASPVTVGPGQGGGGRLGSGRDGAAGPGAGFSGPDYGGNRPPTYPPLARERGYEGTVLLRVEVRRDGRVGGLTIDRSSGYEVLDRAAAESVKEWTFLPARKGGKPVTSWVLLPVKFMLR
jgi:TonB family protein